MVSFVFTGIRPEEACIQRRTNIWDVLLQILSRTQKELNL